MYYFDHVIYKATQDAADWPHVTQWTWPTSELWRNSTAKIGCSLLLLGASTRELDNRTPRWELFNLPSAGKHSPVRRN